MIQIITIIVSSILIGNILGAGYFAWIITKKFFNLTHHRVFNSCIIYEQERIYDIIKSTFEELSETYACMFPEMKAKKLRKILR